MGETNFDKLQRLRQESERWYQQNRGQSVLSGQCPGSTDQHNREIEIERISRRIFPSRYIPDTPETAYRDIVDEVMGVDL